MEIKELKNNLLKIINADNSELQFVYELFLEKLASVLGNSQAVRINGLGVFQRSDDDIYSGKIKDNEIRYCILYYPSYIKDSSLYHRLEVVKRIESNIEFDENVFDLSFNKSFNNNLFINRKSISENELSVEEKIENLIQNSEVVNHIDLLEQLEPTKIEEEIELKSESQQIVIPETIELALDENKEVEPKLDFDINTSFETSNLVIEEEEPVNFDIIEEIENDLIDEDLDEPVLDVDQKIEELIEEIEEIEIKNEALPIIDEFENSKIEIEDSEFDWGEQLKQEIVDEVIDDDFNPTIQDDDYRPKEFQAISNDFDDEITEFELLEDDSKDLFAELEESLKEELEGFNEFVEEYDEDLEKDVEVISEDDGDEFEKIEDLLEKMNSDEFENEVESEEEIDTSNLIFQDSDKETGYEEEKTYEYKKETASVSKEENNGIMAKVKKSMGKAFWTLVIFFIITTSAGVYYFFLKKPTKIPESDLAIIDSLALLIDSKMQNDSMRNISNDSLVQKDSLIEVTKDTLLNIDKIENKQIVKEEPKKTPEVKVLTKEELEKLNNNKVVKPENIVKQEPKKEVLPKEEPKKNETKTTSSNSNIEYRNLTNETVIPGTFIYKIGNTYSVQISSWKNKEKAEKEVRRLKAQGNNAYILEVNLQALGGIWYRVRVGDFKSLEEAKEFSKKNQL